MMPDLTPELAAATARLRAAPVGTPEWEAALEAHRVLVVQVGYRDLLHDARELAQRAQDEAARPAPDWRELAALAHRLEAVALEGKRRAIRHSLASGKRLSYIIPPK